MISKPQGDWGREDRTIEAARQFGGVASRAMSAGTSGVARARAMYSTVVFAMMAFVMGWASLAAGLTGRNLPTFILAGCGSLLLGLMALRNARVAFGSTVSSPVKPAANPAAAGFGRRQETFSPKATMAGDTRTRPPGGGLTITYNRGKLIVMAVKGLAVCLLLACLLLFGKHSSPLLTAFVLIVMGVMLWRVAVLLLRGADKDLTAISWDTQQICVRTLTSSRQVPWQAVESVKTIKRVYRMWGIIPLSSSHELVFRLRHNGSRRLMRVPASALDIRPGLAETLMRVAALSRQT